MCFQSARHTGVDLTKHTNSPSGVIGSLEKMEWMLHLELFTINYRLVALSTLMAIPARNGGGGGTETGAAHARDTLTTL